jgi:hypothetical protein
LARLLVRQRNGNLILGTVHVNLAAGWFSFFVFEMPRGTPSTGSQLGFFTDDLVPLLPMIALAWLSASRVGGLEARRALFPAAFAGGGLLTSPVAPARGRLRQRAALRVRRLRSGAVGERRAGMGRRRAWACCCSACSSQH